MNSASVRKLGRWEAHIIGAAAGGDEEVCEDQGVDTHEKEHADQHLVQWHTVIDAQTRQLLQEVTAHTTDTIELLIRH